MTLTVSEVLRGIDAGIVTVWAGEAIVKVRYCTDCGAKLPAVNPDGRLDTFPRCSAHAF